ncbi:polysaccharide deacetylase family protein [Leifsonia shinshuensis]|uniref:polysaccharide deacetylase family protein n=1 Tax=Leifsonia shinshuensis TaxID=150026 RepID=UPI0028651B08|nr:polysaccharide deacetylase family protein [Leifsonia shinshuensis]MDR6971741.1 peptidoglycan/xylan/chitin deacetylase (PgdA/CDA1 family) [Leifsonia shinshuensis]
MTLRGAAREVVRRVTAPAGSIVSVRTAAPEFVLTYDDGPVAGTTDRLVELLADRGATATFFVLLSRVRRDPALVRSVQEAGHEIALHGVDHVDATTLPGEEFHRRMHDGRRELEDTIGRTVRWYRPPYGHLTFSAWRSVRSAGLVPVLWDASVRDGAGALSDAERLAGAERAAHRGAILLAHDNFASAVDGVDDGPEPVVDRLALSGAVLDAYAARGLAARSLGDALRAGRPVKRGVFVRAAG